MAQLFVSQVIEFPGEGRLERILWIDPVGRGFFAIDIHDPRALPLFRPMEEVEKFEAEGIVRITADDPWLVPVAEATVPEKHRARRDKGWAIIQPLVRDQPGIFRDQQRARAIKQVVSDTGTPVSTIYRYLRRYWQRGMTPNALLPDYDRCGGRGKPKAVSNRKRGRIYREDRQGVNVTPEVRSLIKAVVTRRFAMNRKMDIREAYDEFVLAHFSDRVIDEATGRQVAVTRKDTPTLRQFRYWFEKDNDIFLIERKRRTPRVYDKDMRAILGSSTAETLGPASRYQIDATIADLYLVSRYDRRKIVGRPVLYIVIDVFSRMIVGVYVGFEGPSWVGAMMALANATCEKVDYCRQLGINITEDLWPCDAIPEALLGDRGELAGEAADNLANHLGVRVENTAPYRADWKAVVERRFRLLPAKFKAYTPGYIAQDYKARGADDYRLDATLNIDEFTRIIIHCILYFNNEHRIEGYEKSPAMIADEVQPIPIDLWNWGKVNLSGKLRSIPPETVKLSLMPSADALVTASGIRFQGCFYSCTKAIEEHWFERARQRGTWKVRISYDPRNMDEVYSQEGMGRSTRFIPCALTDKSRHHRGKTLWEIDQIMKDERLQKQDGEHAELQGRINLVEAIKGIIDDAKSDGALQPPDTRNASERVRDIRGNRREERRSNQEREAFRLSAGTAPTGTGDVIPFPVGKPADDYSEPDITEYLRSLEEEGEDGI